MNLHAAYQTLRQFWNGYHPTNDQEGDCPCSSVVVAAAADDDDDDDDDDYDDEVVVDWNEGVAGTVHVVVGSRIICDRICSSVTFVNPMSHQR